MVIDNMYAVGLMIYRFDGEVAIPCACITKQQNSWDLPNVPDMSMHASE